MTMISNRLDSRRGMRILKIVVSLLISVLLVATSLVGSDDVALTSGTQNRLTISFSPQGWASTKVSIDGGDYAVLSFDQSQPSGREGEPQIPVRVVVVGVPLDARITWSLLDAPYDESSTETILPVPKLVKDEMGIVREIPVRDDSIYRSDEPFPSSPVEVSEPAMFRNQRVVKVILKPVQYLPRQNRIRRYSMIKVGLEFGGGEPAHSVGRQESDEGLYRSLLANYEQAKTWRKVRQRLTKKSSRSMLDGVWYKMYVSQDGMYKVDGNRLSSAGVNLSAIDPATLRVYNNGGQELPRDITVSRPDSLIENPIFVVDGGDKRFDASDYILFHGRGVEGWEYDVGEDHWSHYINHYTSENVYWLTWGQGVSGKRIETGPSGSAVDATPVTSFVTHVFSEEDFYNPFHSGFYWFGRLFTDGDSRSYTIEMPGAVTGGPADVLFRFVAASAGKHTFNTSINGNSLGAAIISGWSESGIRFGDWQRSISGHVVSGINTVGVRYSASSVTAQGHLDWIEGEYTRSLVASGDELLIYAPAAMETYSYSISGFGRDDITVLNVTDFSSVMKIEPTAISSGTVTFVDASRTPDGKRYLAFTPATYRTPTRIELDESSDLRSPEHTAELIIITHDDFYSQAIELGSLRETWNPNERIETEVVKISDVYDEFSCGLVDATAIRDFLRYAFENWGGPPQYVLLFGDGDYDYRNILSSGDANWLPPYEGTETSEGSSRTTDDWFCYISGNDDQMDLAIGRLTVRSTDEAQRVVDKIVNYETRKLFGDWRNRIVAVADDELRLGGQVYAWELTHTQDTEAIIEGTLPRSFDVKKIYLIEYPAVRSPSISGVVKPTANQALLDQINRGCLIINFIGHGAPQLWTHERVLNSPVDFDKIQNGDKYALWIAATCSFARFDDPYEQSMPEDLLAVEGRGAIAIVASTREAYSGPNADFNKRLLARLFDTYTSQGLVSRCGDAFLLAKANIGDPDNAEKYVLLGDPTTRLVAPRYKVVIESTEPDTIKALGLMTVKGRVEREGSLWSDFDGNVLVKVFDTRKAKTYTLEGGGGVNYTLPGNVIFRGAAAAANGRFDISFYVPKDISYGGKEGRISAYFWNDEADGMGYREGLPVGGTAATVVDQVGPEIAISFKGRSFATGEYVGSTPILRVEIGDSVSGVNIAGDIGHKITMVLNSDIENRKDLTEFFNYDQGSYTKGSLEYQLLNLEEGSHHIEVKAWDNSNNSSVSTADFTVVSETELILRNVLNYPNPMKGQTDFTFEVSREAEVTIKIYTLAGRLVKTIKAQATANFNAIRWDGLDEDGDRLANGLYLYQVKARAPASEGDVEAEGLGKLVVAE